METLKAVEIPAHKSCSINILFLYLDTNRMVIEKKIYVLTCLIFYFGEVILLLKLSILYIYCVDKTALFRIFNT